MSSASVAATWWRRLWAWMSQWDGPIPYTEPLYGANCEFRDDDGSYGRVGAQGQG